MTNTKNGSNQGMVPEARAAMDRFKMEAAAEVGVNLKQGYNGEEDDRLLRAEYGKPGLNASLSCEKRDTESFRVPLLMLSLPVCGTAHQVFCRTCLSISSSRSRLRPKQNRRRTGRGKRHGFAQIMLVILISDIRFPIQVKFYPSEQCKAAASQGNGGFLLLLRTLSSP